MTQRSPPVRLCSEGCLTHGPTRKNESLRGWQAARIAPWALRGQVVWYRGDSKTKGHAANASTSFQKAGSQAGPVRRRIHQANHRQERISGAPTYSEDCLRVWGQSTDFMTDPKFLDAYDTGMSTGHHIMREEGSKEDIGIHWRVVTCCWAATHAVQLDGRFCRVRR